MIIKKRQRWPIVGISFLLLVGVGLVSYSIFTSTTNNKDAKQIEKNSSSGSNEAKQTGRIPGDDTPKEPTTDEQMKTQSVVVDDSNKDVVETVSSPTDELEIVSKNYDQEKMVLSVGVNSGSNVKRCHFSLGDGELEVLDETKTIIANNDSHGCRVTIQTKNLNAKIKWSLTVSGENENSETIATIKTEIDKHLNQGVE